MASEQAAPTVNGNYVTQDSHHSGASEEHTSPDSRLDATSSVEPASDTFGSQNANVRSSSGAASADDAHSDVPKHEVGWYFVKQYYTNLSRSPEKWHLFYHKKSQFVFGVEAEKVPVSVGRTAIAERIKALEFQDCKVRVSNVDVQASFENIVIQVIGEISNKSAPHRKFVQSFVLTQQPTGYYVLNDVFRYINEEDEEDPDVEVYHEGEPSQQATEGQDEAPIQDGPKTSTDSNDSEQQQPDVEQVDAELEKTISKQDDEPQAEQSQAQPDEPAQAPVSNGASTDEVTEEQKPREESQDVQHTEQDEQSPPAETKAEPDEVPEEAQPEQPKEPEPTPAVTPPKPTPKAASPPQTAAQPKPAAPKTWANLVAGSRPTPSATPSPGSSTSPAPSQQRAAPPPADTPETTPSPVQQGSSSGWQTAGNDHARRQSRPQSTSGAGDKVMAYVKNVTEKVSSETLREMLLQYGDLVYFDISRQRNCAFVEFSTPAGYQAAVAANPHLISGEQIYIEERRARPGFGPGGFNTNRGGPGRGRGGPDGRIGQGRGGFQKDGGRGNHGPSRGRGGTLSPRGRGGNQNG
ncbi:MAG: hypothetical protein M1816_006981 [Peltula sp. TS41687]|nr:MAG: hypothetical protein M1816_006981 [Peltula sp. TS41687]